MMASERKRRWDDGDRWGVEGDAGACHMALVFRSGRTSGSSLAGGLTKRLTPHAYCNLADRQAEGDVTRLVKLGIAWG